MSNLMLKSAGERRCLGVVRIARHQRCERKRPDATTRITPVNRHKGGETKCKCSDKTTHIRPRSRWMSALLFLLVVSKRRLVYAYPGGNHMRVTCRLYVIGCRVPAGVSLVCFSVG